MIRRADPPEWCLTGMPKPLITVVATLLAVLSIGSTAHACSCPKFRPCQTFWTAETVLIARAQSVVQKGSGTFVTRLVVEEWLRGERVGAELTTTSYGVGGSCDYGFQQGVRYLVHANRRADSTWSVFLCGGTAPIEQAAGDLKYIRDALAQPGDGTLSIHSFVDIDPGKGVKSGPPPVGARLLLRGSGRQLKGIVGPEGAYRFDAVPAGEYTFTVELPPDYAPVPPKQITTGRGACLIHLFTASKR
jgi:hypothetical protein